MNLVQPGRAAAASPKLSSKAERFTESVIREMTRLAMRHNAVNLSQGFPDFPAPAEIKRMWIAPDARGLGLGRRLLHTLETCARDAGASVARI